MHHQLTAVAAAVARRRSTGGSAPAIVGTPITNTVGPSDNLVITLNPFTSGNGKIIFFIAGASLGVNSAIDNASNAWTEIYTNSDGSQRIHMVALSNITNAPTTLTINLTVSQFIRYYEFEISGEATTASLVDGASLGSGTSTTTVLLTETPSAPVLLIGGIYISPGTTPTAANGSSLLTPGGSTTQFALYRVTSGGASETLDATLGASANFNGWVVSILGV